MDDIEKEIDAIKKRNRTVESDKAWETSWTRRIFIAVITYLIASWWMAIIGEAQVFFKACVPTGGYLLSTLSLPFVKRWWAMVFQK